MITLVHADHDQLKPGEAILISKPDGKFGLIYACPGCGNPVGTTAKQDYDQATMTIMMDNVTSSCVHNVDLGGCGYHKTLVNGEWV